MPQTKKQPVTIRAERQTLHPNGKWMTSESFVIPMTEFADLKQADLKEAAITTAADHWKGVRIVLTIQDPNLFPPEE